MSSSNKARDRKRDISRAIRESQRSRMDALEEFARGLTELRTMRTRLKELEARVDGELRAGAKAAGNSAADIRNVERIVNELAGREEVPSTPDAGADAPASGNDPDPQPWREGE
ncbi:hypothetical protein [Bifidobacterium dentium]|uniref:hypothetical protein n=1 Tax=Bifidobacterium dentium TaxID=1689 RepID=UPI0018B09E0C|nr:hypothetical protein [Bifidobacterium dentium]MBF9694389.1 hypothetical protein [Bifidobacterium dentium]